MLAIAERLEGLYSNASTHAAGVVIGDRPLIELAPLYRDPKSAMPATQFNMKWVEPAGLVKFDFLGLKTLTVLKRAVDLVARRGIAVDLSKIPLDDVKTYEMLGRGETVGRVPGGKRRHAQGAGRDARRPVRGLDRAGRALSPGPDGEHSRLLRAQARPGEGRIRPSAPGADPQGDLRRHHLSGAGAADRARTSPAIRSRRPTCCAARWARRSRRRWTRSASVSSTGAVERGIDRATADAIFDACAKFAEYGFNKSHSAPYAFITYQTAWFKANHPAEFLAASMTLDKGNTDKLAEFRAEAQRLGIKVMAPSVNESLVDFDVRAERRRAPTIHYALERDQGRRRSAGRGAG